MCSNTLNERSSVFIGEAAAGVGDKVYSDVLEAKGGSCGERGGATRDLSSSPAVPVEPGDRQHKASFFT